VAEEALRLDTAPAATVDDLLAQVVQASAEHAGLPAAQHDRVRQDVRWIVRYTGAAVLTDDPSVLDDLLGSMLRMPHDGVPDSVVLDRGRGGRRRSRAARPSWRHDAAQRCSAGARGGVAGVQRADGRGSPGHPACCGRERGGCVRIRGAVLEEIGRARPVPGSRPPVGRRAGLPPPGPARCSCGCRRRACATRTCRSSTATGCGPCRCCSGHEGGRHRRAGWGPASTRCAGRPRRRDVPAALRRVRGLPHPRASAVRAGDGVEHAGTLLGGGPAADPRRAGGAPPPRVSGLRDARRRRRALARAGRQRRPARGRGAARLRRAHRRRGGAQHPSTTDQARPSPSWDWAASGWLRC
jgi:hypothetical protein